jgi:predicted TPR repeat methyltransferase
MASRKHRIARPAAAPQPRAPSVSERLLALGGQGNAPAPAPVEMPVQDLGEDKIGAALAAMRRERDVDQRIANLRASLAQTPHAVELWLALADLEHKRGRHDAALAAYRQCLALAPGRDDVRHLIDALSGGKLPARAPDNYVAGLFDGIAATFDETLVHWLGYRAPEMTLAMAKAVLGPRPAPQRILDLGCGTGLNGPLFRSMAQRLDGVDLSPKMVEKARARGLYDDLAVDEIGRYLAAATRRYSLVLATDVLVYFGDLSGVFAGVRGVLKSAGRFVATTEIGTGAPFALGRSGRYMHGEGYVRATALAHGLEVVAAETGALRQEGGKPVVGMCYAMRKRA